MLSHEEEDVRKYALALIPYSVDQEAVLEFAQAKISENGGEEFKRELGTLMALMNSTE